MGEQTTYINKKESNKNKEELFYFEKSEFDKIIKTKSNWVTKKESSIQYVKTKYFVHDSKRRIWPYWNQFFIDRSS